jgi:hypothetical protein
MAISQSRWAGCSTTRQPARRIPAAGRSHNLSTVICEQHDGKHEAFVVCIHVLENGAIPDARAYGEDGDHWLICSECELYTRKSDSVLPEDEMKSWADKNLILRVGDLVTFEIATSRTRPDKTCAINVRLDKRDELTAADVPAKSGVQS